MSPTLTPSPVLYCLLGLLGLLGMACGETSSNQSAQQAKLPAAKANGFQLRVFQDGKELALKDGLVQLRPEDFVLEVQAHQLPGLFAHLCPQQLESGADGQPLLDLSELAARTVASTQGNEDNELIIDCETYHYWAATNRQNTGFNDLLRQGGQWTGRLSVNGFYFPEEEIVMDVREMKRDLHLYFFAASAATDSLSAELLQGEYLKIEWL
ncbi:MAG: hypothetical protein AAFV95_08955 [Bacteroidota bacterium]